MTKVFKNNFTQDLFTSIQSGQILPMVESLFGTEKKEIINQAISNKKEGIKELFSSIHLNDLLSFFHDQIEVQIEYMRKNRFTKLACFTENIHSKFMWDLYANGYKGYALEYDFRDYHLKGCSCCRDIQTCTDVQKNISNIYPIIYSNSRYDATESVIRLIQQDVFNKLSATSGSIPIDLLHWYKTYLYKDKKEYGHEKEWRLICRCPTDQSQDFSEISDRGCLKAIYYGPYMDKKYRQHLGEIAKGLNLKEYEVNVDEYCSQYKLKITQVKGLKF